LLDVEQTVGPSKSLVYSIPEKFSTDECNEIIRKLYDPIAEICDQNKLKFNNFIYRKDKQRDDKYYWRCTKVFPKCNGRINTMFIDNKHYVVSVQEHNHDTSKNPSTQTGGGVSTGKKTLNYFININTKIFFYFRF
jgi:hypothetical protein